jgi:hypothetical protein
LLLAALAFVSLLAVFLSTSVGSLAGADGLFGAPSSARAQTIEGSFRSSAAADYASRDERRVAPISRQRSAPAEVIAPVRTSAL